MEDNLSDFLTSVEGWLDIKPMMLPGLLNYYPQSSNYLSYEIKEWQNMHLGKHALEK